MRIARAPRTTRSTAFHVPKDAGPAGLSAAIDSRCNQIERAGNRVVSVSHAFMGNHVTVVVAYTVDD